ncbi:branched-chain amino acid aminotransferase [Fodinicurvata fenggangensis]|uniref:branched-chain amino acid aminotransferase n=1 Tax=Fodinicurvata fenggangensis TaxID=1121830 RepID=UPI00047E1129|nr:branched-chain amino acid aminotransferase [Fodinicurvata fenggangensis]
MKVWNFHEGEWIEGNPPLLRPMSHSFWLGSMVFDGARAYEGIAPDLDLHCARVIESARNIGLAPFHSADELLELCREGLKHFDPEDELYIRPAYWAEEGFVDPDPETTRFCLTIHEAPMPEPKGSAITLSPFRRPTPETAPTHAKASCLYPHAGRALRDAKARGFGNAVMLDALGNVAELATANIWLSKDGVARTPVPNGTFLNGITRQRIIKLFQEADLPVEEVQLTYRDFLEADEIFSTGNYGKVMPVTRIEDRELQPGPLYKMARELYWDWSHSE